MILAALCTSSTGRIMHLFHVWGPSTGWDAPGRVTYDLKVMTLGQWRHREVLCTGLGNKRWYKSPTPQDTPAQKPGSLLTDKTSKKKLSLTSTGTWRGPSHPIKEWTDLKGWSDGIAYYLH
jgi:hypothetical protein